MKTYLDCIPCFFRQLLESARIAKAGRKRQKKVMDGFAGLIPVIPLTSSPPEIARLGYALLKKIGCNHDPYREIKRKSNRIALRLLGKLKDKVRHSRDRLLTALGLAIAGNVIDFGVKNNIDVKDELKKILAQKKKGTAKSSIFHYTEFKRALKKSDTILYLADNAGEVVFDRILIEEIKDMYPEKDIYYAVKERPVINDALREDAVFCGIDKYAQIISNGTDAPGTILSLCSKEFRRVYAVAEMIISKGQGNFESLSETKHPVFFLFMVKCPVVARETGCVMGEPVLYYNLKQYPRGRFLP
jgi:damage-control phosphatase, subfamily I